MLAEKRTFNGLVLASPRITSAESLLRTLPDSDLEGPVIENLQDVTGVTSWQYYSEDRFSISRELDQHRVVRQGREYYQYPILVMEIPLNRAKAFLFAVPFASLLRHILKTYISLIGNMQYRFFSVNLGRAATALRAGQHAGGSVQLKAVDYLVIGDPKTDGLQFRGKDVVHSSIHQLLIESTKKPGLALKERRLTIAYRPGSGPAFILETDRYGNMRFRISSGKANLVSASLLLRFLDEQQLWNTSLALPVDRAELDEEEEL